MDFDSSFWVNGFAYYFDRLVLGYNFKVSVMILSLLLGSPCRREMKIDFLIVSEFK